MKSIISDCSLGSRIGPDMKPTRRTAGRVNTSKPQTRNKMPSLSSRFAHPKPSELPAKPTTNKPRARRIQPSRASKPGGRGKSIPVQTPIALPSSPPVAEKRRILVVDDDDPVRKLLTRILERDGFSIDTARDGGEGLQKIGAAGPDGYCLILLDLMMPNISGFDVIEHFKLHQPELLGKTVVVTASPKVDRGNLQKELLRGIVEKPFDIKELSAYVRKCVDSAGSDSLPRR